MERDHDILIRIDERTQAMAKRLEDHVEAFDEHVKTDQANFESLKGWRSYVSGAAVVLGAALYYLYDIIKAMASAK